MWLPPCKHTPQDIAAYPAHSNGEAAPELGYAARAAFEQAGAASSIQNCLRFLVLKGL